MFWSMCISNQRVWEHNHPLFFQAVALIYLRYRCFEKAGITRCLRVISQHGEGVLRWADIPFYDIGLGVGQTSKGCNMLGRWCIQLSGTSNARATVNLYSHKSRSSGCRRRKTLSPQLFDIWAQSLTSCIIGNTGRICFPLNQIGRGPAGRLLLLWAPWKPSRMSRREKWESFVESFFWAWRYSPRCWWKVVDIWVQQPIELHHSHIIYRARTVHAHQNFFLTHTHRSDC